MPTAERRAAILRAAGPLFAHDGYAGTRLDDVAAAAGVTKPILYRHFESKKALYVALLDKHEADLPTFFEQVDGVAPDLPPEQLVRLILGHWLDYVHENQHAWAMLFRDASGDEDLRRRRTEVSVRAREVMAGFVTASGDGVPAEQVEPTAELLTSGLAGLALWWIDRPEVPKATVVDAAARLCVPAIGGT